jgi:PAT family beta-lactamase induction signal transducer AmpG
MSLRGSPFRSRRVAALFFLGFSSGLPYLLVGSTLAARLVAAGISLPTIGVYALAGLPFSLKFAWAPLLDRYPIPWLGRRRGWLALLQLALCPALVALGAVDPRVAPVAAAALAALVSLLAATQDVAADAYAADVLAPDERAAGTALYVAGYRLGMVASGAAGLALADFVPFSAIYAAAGAALAACVAATVWAPEPRRVAPPSTLGEAVAAPFADFFRRRGAAAALAFVVLYRMGDTAVMLMVTPFLLGLGFGRVEIGAVSQGVGLAATVAGTFLGGALVPRLGLWRALWTFGVLQAATNVGYLALALVGARHDLLWAAITVDNLFNGLAIAAVTAFLMSLCRPRYSATQFALLTSAAGIGGRLVGAAAGWLVARAGWGAFFALTMAGVVPALALLGPMRRAGVFDIVEA